MNLRRVMYYRPTALEWIGIIALFALAIMLIASCVGCNKQDQNAEVVTPQPAQPNPAPEPVAIDAGHEPIPTPTPTITFSPDGKFTFDQTISRKGGSHTDKSTAETKGSSGKTSSDKGTLDLDTKASPLSLPGITASAGGGNGQAKVENFQFPHQAIILILAAIASAGWGAFQIYQKKPIHDALPWFALAGILAAIAFYPELLLYGAITAIVLGAGFLIHKSSIAKKLHDTKHEFQAQASTTTATLDETWEALKAYTSGLKLAADDPTISKAPLVQNDKGETIFTLGDAAKAVTAHVRAQMSRRDITVTEEALTEDFNHFS